MIHLHLEYWILKKVNNVSWMLISISISVYNHLYDNDSLFYNIGSL